MRLRVGVIGLGPEWDSRHRPALLALGDRFHVESICDEVSLRAENAARQIGAKAVNGFRKLVAAPEIEAVLMLGPQWHGVEPLIAACEEGKAFYCTSILEIAGANSATLRDSVDRAGIAFMAEFPRRHSPATIRLKELIATRLGAPQLLFCHERIRKPENGSADRFGQRPVKRHVAELVDWCRYVVGTEPQTVFGVQHRKDADNNLDYEMLSVEFDSPTGGAPVIAQISAGSYLQHRWPEASSFRPPAALQVCCANGVAFVDLPSTLIWFDEAGRHMESLDHERPVGEQMLSLFHRSVTSLLRNTSCLNDVDCALRVMRAADESNEQRTRVAIETS